jgi:hypothetical protein
MADHTDARRIDLGQVGQGAPAVGGHISVIGKRLALRRPKLRFPGIAPGRADGEGDKTAPGELQAKVPEGLWPEPNAGFRLVIQNEHGRKMPFALRDQQPAFSRLARGDFQANTVAPEILARQWSRRLARLGGRLACIGFQASASRRQRGRRLGCWQEFDLRRLE